MAFVLCAVNRLHKDDYSTLIMTMKQDMSEDSFVTNATEVSEHSVIHSWRLNGPSRI